MEKKEEKNVNGPGVFMNPLTDVGFKNAFVRNKATTMEFLNVLLEGQESEIVDLEFLDKEFTRSNRDGRNVIYDLYCRTSDDRHIIIEMQRAPQENFRERALYYMSRSVVNQGEPGDEWGYELNAVYGVFLMDFFLEGSENRKQLRKIKLTEQGEDHQVFYDKFIMYFVEIPATPKREEDCKTKLDCFTYILKNMEQMTTLPFKGWLKTLDELEETMRLASMDKEGRELYEHSLKQYRDIKATLAYYKNRLAQGYEKGMAQGYEKGMAQGYENGMAQGMAQGMAEGETKGRAEGEAKGKRDTALKLKQLNIPVSVIAESTGLTEQEISKL